MITIQSIPETLKSDKSITPFIIHSLELSTINPIVSYYCKFYVLDYILTNKLHTTSKDIETFTIELLDDTEKIKNSTEDEDLHKILTNKEMSLTAVLSFSYKLFNSCVENLNNLKRTDKPAVISKFKACLNFLALLTIFKSSDDVNWNKLTGGKAENYDEFNKLNKEKTKVLKYHLSKLIKDDVNYVDDVNDEELEKELESELKDLQEGQEVDVVDKEESEEQELDLIDTEDKGQQEQREQQEQQEQPVQQEQPHQEDTFKLPGAPHFPPDATDEVKLPGAPTYLPDGDITGINKHSSIQVFPPSEPEKHVPPPASRKISTSSIHARTSHAPPITKETIKQILNRDDTITQVQKHSKFAISALQFEDFDEAEKQLKQGLELLKILKQQEEN